MSNVRGYNLPILIRQTATTAANAVVWAVFNPAGSRRTLYLRRITGNALCDVVAAVATQSNYGIRRFRSATPSGGSALTPVPHHSGDLSPSGAAIVSVASARQLDTGLTVAGIVTDPPFAQFGCPRAPGASGYFDFSWYPIDTGEGRDAFSVVQGDGVAITLDLVAVVGDGIQGTVVWDEVGF